MKNYRLQSAAILLIAGFSIAKADYNPSNNASATQLKTGNRNATTGMEAVFYNPAGTVFGEEGFSVEFSLLPSYSTQSIYDSGLDKNYESVTSSIFYPALNLLYVKEKFSVFSNIGITNGGGAGNYEDGLPTFEYLGMYNISLAMLAGASLPSTSIYDYSYESNFSGSAYGIGGSIGAAYKITDWLSAAVAVQYSYQTNHTEGELVVGYPAASMDISTTEVDIDETGMNFGFIFGLDIKPTDKLLIAQTFRYYTELELETTVNDGKDGDGMYEDGATSLSTYVPFYSLGLSYEVTEKLRLEADMNLSLYSILDLSSSEDDDNAAEYYNNGFDFGLAAEYQFTDKLNWGIGFTYAPAKMKEEYMDEMEFENNTIWLNTGFTYKTTDKLDLNIAFQTSVPTGDVTVDYDGYSQTYEKGMSYALGLGAAYRF